MSSVAQQEKDKGNAAFKTGDFPTAIGHYTAAFLADPANATYPLNRAAAYLKLGKNEDAERDCDTVLRLDGENVKGYFRRGQARLALQKLKEAESDFQHALRLEPANQSVKQELQKVQDAIKAAPPPKAPRKPIDISSPAQTPSTSTLPPKRRRVPITIVEPDSTPALTSTSSGKGADLLTPVSSRPLNGSAAQGSQTPATPTPTDTASSTSNPPPQSFKEAKAAREEARPRGGIFRSDGRTSLFYAPDPSNGETKAPKREPPQTLVAFMRIWETLKTEDERWDVLRQIPAARLPALFKTSLDASVLGGILRSLRVALAAEPDDGERAEVVRAYMVNLPRVPRFSTVSMMMKDDERAEAQTVWDLLGRARKDGVEGEKDKRKEDGSRAAWGCH